MVGLSAGDSLNVRSSPSASSASLFRLLNGQEVQVTGEPVFGEPVFNNDTEWMPIQYGKKQGWVNGAFLKPKSPMNDHRDRHCAHLGMRLID